MQVAVVFVSVTVTVFCIWIQMCECQDTKEQSSVAISDKKVLPLSSRIVDTSPRNLEISSHEVQEEPELRQHSVKLKKKPKLKLKKSKKFLKKFLPFLLIPLIIQAKLIPLFLFKLKLIALKAFGIGKLALLLVLINVIYNAMYKAQDVDQQYSQEVLASEHYGYNGGPEYGAWVN